MHLLGTVFSGGFGVQVSIWDNRTVYVRLSQNNLVFTVTCQPVCLNSFWTGLVSGMHELSVWVYTSVKRMMARLLPFD